MSNVRQQWLHQCLVMIRAPEDGKIEFYHLKRRGPFLHQLAQFGHGWRKTLSKERGGKNYVGGPGSVRTFLWHPCAQAQFLLKALVSNVPIGVVPLS